MTKYFVESVSKLSFHKKIIVKMKVKKRAFSYSYLYIHIYFQHTYI